MNPDLIAEIRAALNILGNWHIGPPGGRTGFGKRLRHIYADGISIRVSGDDADRVAMCLQDLRNHAPALLDEIERLQEKLNRWTGVFAGITPENMRQRMSDLSIANAQLTARVAELTAELDDYCRADANINYALNEGDRNINHETAQP